MVSRGSSRLSALTFVGFALVTTEVRADDASCIESHVEAQRLRRARKVRAARDALVECANPACPSIIVGECTEMLTEIDKAVPTIVLEARDPTGRDLGDVRVTIGGVVIAKRLGGRSLEIDPGEHTFRFEAPGAAPVDRTVIIREGDKNRRIAVVLGEPKSAPVPVEPAGGERRISPAFWVSGSIGVAGLALFGGLGVAGLVKRGELDDLGCQPNCPTADVDETRGLFLGADISLAIGVAGLALAPIFYFTSPVDTEPRTKDTVSSLRLGIAGSTITVGGAF